MAILELPTKPLRQSLLWRLQAQYYEEGGLSSWDNGIVPNWITSNNFIGNEFGTAIIYALRDMLNTKRLNLKEPIYIVELGSGTGKFAHLCIATIIEKLSILTRSASVSTSLQKIKLKYIMTDFSSNPIVEWLKNPLLMKYVDQGILDFGLYDAHTSQSIALWHEQRSLTPNGTDIVNPLFIISNYTFDSLRQDSFRIVGSSDNKNPNQNDDNNNNNNATDTVTMNNTVYEGRLCIKSKLSTEDNETEGGERQLADDPRIFLRMDNTWEYKPLTKEEIETYYKEDKDAGITEEMAIEMNYLLDWYSKNAFTTTSSASSPLTNCNPLYSSSSSIIDTDESSTNDKSSSLSSFTFPFPVGPLQCLHNLRKLGQTGGLVVLMADKGFSNPYYFRGSGNVDIHIHGCISMMVNYHALQLWIESQGGNVLITNDDDVHIKVGIFALFPPSSSFIPGTTTMKMDTTLPETTMDGNDTVDNCCFDIRIYLPLLTDIFYDRLQKFGPSEFWDIQNIFPDTYSSSVYQRKGITGSTLNIVPNDHSPTKLNITEMHSSIISQTTNTNVYVDSDSENEGAARPNPYTLTHSFPSSSSSPSVSVGQSSSNGKESNYSVPITLRSAIALCRLSNWDPDTFYKFRDLIAARLPSLSPPRRQQIFDGISIMWKKAFPSPGSRQEYDVSFEIGRIFYLTNDYKRALTFFIESLNTTGPHSTTYFNIAMCCFHMQQYRHAKEWLKKAIDYTKEYDTENGDYPLARSWLQMCEEELLVEASIDSGYSVMIPSTTTVGQSSSPSDTGGDESNRKHDTLVSSGSTASPSNKDNSSVDTLSSSAMNPQPSLQRLILPGRSNVKLYI